MANVTAPHPAIDPRAPAPRINRAPVAQPLTEQEAFDATVRHTSNVAFVGLGALAVVAALAMSTLALIQSNRSPTSAAVSMPMSPAGLAVTGAPIQTPASTPTIYLSVAGSNKLGPDGKMHDSFSKTDFAVKAGKPTVLRIANGDSSPHTITATATGVSITVLPGTHSYTMLATRTGRFEWVCVLPCDSDTHGWAMSHPGYMAGYITAT